MTTPGNLSEQVLALPGGAGNVRSAGETFSADPHTGTGSYRVPIEVPPGHAGIAPSLALVYSTHGGNGVAGVGWSLGLAEVSRRIDKGLPTFDDETDTFALQGDELLPCGANRYRARVDLRFARVRHVRGGGRDFWSVEERDGTRVLYGLEAGARLQGGPNRISRWYVSKKQDANGNEVTYSYRSDPATRAVYLSEVAWAGCYRVVFDYEERPDATWAHDHGFAMREDQRLLSIRVQVRRQSDAVWHTFRTYTLGYDRSAATGRSLLAQVRVAGTASTGESRALPSVSFAYSGSDARPSKWHEIVGQTAGSLADRNLTLVRQSGSGLPDLLETTSTAFVLHENLGNGTFAVGRVVPAPAQTRLADPGVFISDMDGDGWGDLVVAGGRRVYAARDGGGWSDLIRAGDRPTADLDDPRVRLADLTGNGLPDLLQQGDGAWWFYENTGDGGWAPAVRVTAAAAVRLDDPRVHLADLTGDGLSDLVYVGVDEIVVWPGVGRGRFGEPISVDHPFPRSARLDPRGFKFVDLTGSGAADLLFVDTGVAMAACGRGDLSFAPPQVLAQRRQSAQGHVEPVDLLGTGAMGLLFSDSERSWRFLELFPEGVPDLLSHVDNGIGGSTSIDYGSSGAHWARDRVDGRTWLTAMPMAQRVVDSVTTRDTVTGMTLGVEYRYRDGVYDGEEREFRGFAQVEQVEQEAPIGDPQPLPPTLIRRWFHTGQELDHRFEFAPSPAGTLADEVPKVPWALRSLRGLLYREETYAQDGNARPYLVNETGYRVFPVQRTPGTQRYSFAPLAVRTRSTYTERTRERRTLETTTIYDLHVGAGYGLPVEVREKGLGRTGSFATDHEQQQQQTLERYTRTTYVAKDETDGGYDGPYTPHYLAGFATKVERWAVSGTGDVLLSRELSFYDGDDYEGSGYPNGTSSITRGRLSCKLVLALTDDLRSSAFPSGSGADDAFTNRGHYLTLGTTDHYVHVERYKYDSKGMTVGSKDANGNETTFVYDATYALFPEEMVDPAGHPTTLTRGELWFQVEATEDANGNRVEFTYDPSGLPATKSVMGKYLGGAWQGDPPTHPTEGYVYDFDAQPIEVVVKTRQIRMGATFDVHRYLDGLGRVVQERHTAEPDPDTSATRYRVTGWQIFNHKGLVVKAFQPVFAASATYAAGDTTTAFVETTYDPLGRPVRVDYPDGTFDTTDYHPWVQTFSDRNDNAGGLTNVDARYGANLHTLRAHLDTPTRRYMDAFGREIAVAEDSGAGLAQTFRVTTYEVRAGQFTGTTYDLTLENELLANYFVMIRGSVNDTGANAPNVGVRVTKDPFASGDLTTSSGADVIRLERGSATQGDWIGTIVVWECLGDTTKSGFRLVDVKEVSFSGTSAGSEQTTTATTTTSWNDIDQVVLYGGPRGGGSTAGGGGADAHCSLWAKLYPSSTNTVNAARYGGGSVALESATFTVYVVEWGEEHTIQRIVVAGSAGGDALDSGSEFDTTDIDPVRRAHTWCWFSAWTQENGIGDSPNGLLVALGDGTTWDDVETKVAIGCETAVSKSAVVYVHTHPDLSVDWRRKDDGDSGVSSHTQDVMDVGETETYDEVSNPRSTQTLRVPVHTHTMGATSDRYDQGVLFSRHTDARDLKAERLQSGVAWVAMSQSVDTVGVTRPDTGSAQLHVTRSVLDLKDQVLEVWDARGLAFATWTFAYDYAGRRLVADHATAAGVRYALADAAGNPIWSRDARDIEVDRTFDTLNRPLTESTDDGTDVKLRRMWTYIDYDDTDPNFANWQAKNIFGRVEEERDADGIRFFTYDWRGLVTKASHRFWDVDWTNGSATVWTDGASWDPEISSTDRGSLTWLALEGLTDTETAEISTTYDSAGRPVVVSYPEMDTSPSAEQMVVSTSFNEAGLLDGIEIDRGAGGGAETILTDVHYNARGQVIGYTHGNDVRTTREYDADLERLLRIYTRLPSAPSTRFQDLNYDYDPVGNPVQITDELATTTYRANEIIPNTRTFRYDPRYRLIRATGKKHPTVGDKTSDIVISTPVAKDYEPYTFRYSYDEVGNFTTNQEYRSGTNTLEYKAGRIDLFNGDVGEAVDDDPELGNFRYDANGNTTKTPRQSELAYTFDNQARYVDMSGGGEVRYLRHGDQRVVRLVKKSGVKALGIYLGPWEYHDRRATTSFIKAVLHVTGHDRHAQIERVISGTDSDSLATFYTHGDHLASGHVLTKDDGALLSQEEYFPYGRPSDRRDARSRYRFIGVERDEELAMCLTGPRLLDVLSGRFLTPDPAGPANVASGPYTYSRGRPLSRRDPGGYQDIPATPDGTSSPSGPAEGKAARPFTRSLHLRLRGKDRGQATVSINERYRVGSEDAFEIKYEGTDQGRVTFTQFVWGEVEGRRPDGTVGRFTRYKFDNYAPDYRPVKGAAPASASEVSLDFEGWRATSEKVDKPGIDRGAARAAQAAGYEDIVVREHFEIYIVKDAKKVIGRALVTFEYSGSDAINSSSQVASDVPINVTVTQLPTGRRLREPYRSALLRGL
jgi:RHS repeat-associated protein